ncbi:serine/threonine protein kinase cds1, putative [Entamoeba dispar SAW760]|uniref:non-specific serine/threonine protein kinase n=1 Tax=Entamoeba dispar (strain ATCC PRA-260 / SAW760) TaxID=370354 RepID=B0ECW5_ENTDS|nr:serine/threonine protein kinase cds1, putative [Entamoeba dispar SAW760]EDR27657.1 serine/threonine protein kinase cds1, putative [Entamoeba dispar SAW760]|eukprot:EDR27657.1 serine/threonine protein kinase cds1, putative [Entamoeba dispar SAW760]
MTEEKKVIAELQCNTKGYPSLIITEKKTTLGRCNSACEISNDTISYTHCSIITSSIVELVGRPTQRRYYFVDTSTNGSYINYEKAPTKEAIEIMCFDEISLLRPKKDEGAVSYCLIDKEIMKQENERCHVFDNYKLSNLVGSGGTGTVRKVFKGKEVYAMKILHYSDLTDKKKSQIERECEVMSKLNHPNIVKYYQSFSGIFNKYIIMEFVDGYDLFHIVFTNNLLKEEFIKKIMFEILTALLYLHSIGVIHRDLKPENIMIQKESYQVKLTDFGFGRTVDETHRADTMCGTDVYAAPEIYRGLVYDGCKADVWSAGVVFFVMATKEYPFMHKSDNNPDKMMVSHIVKGERYHYDEFEQRSDLFKDLINNMLNIDSQKRFTVKQCLSHEFFSRKRDKTKTKLSTEPKKSLK